MGSDQVAAAQDTLRRRGTAPSIGRHGANSSEGLGPHRWIVERTNVWILACGRVAVARNQQDVAGGLDERVRWPEDL